MTTDPVEIFETHRTLLFSIAYRMLGRVMEAEDVVQETYLRFAASDVAAVRVPKAFLTTIVTRLCLDHLKSARVEREQYVGPWLPEPLLTEETGPAHALETKESISMAFLVLLESLTPVERAVFLLREVFAYEYAEIAAIVEKSEANCRQLYSRAKQHLVARRPRFDPSPAMQQKLVQGFLQAVAEGNVDGLTQVLAEDVQWWSDGGGRVPSATRPLAGRETVIRFLLGIKPRAPSDLDVVEVAINGSPALLLTSGGRVFAVWSFTIIDGAINQIHAVLNPDKLRHLVDFE